MKQFMRVIPATLALVFALSVVASAQNMKIAFIKDDEIKAGYKAWQKAQESWEIERKAWEDEAQKQQTELQTMVEEYDKQRLILSEDKRNQREAAIRAKQQSLETYTRNIFGPNGTAEQKQLELLQPLLDNVTKAIETVAIENGFDVIFTSQSGIGYIKPTLDVTQKVLEALERIDIK